MMGHDRKIIVVLGAGRCGTSLLIQVLAQLGMEVSENLVPPRAHNPVGPMEDAEIATIYDQIILPGIHSTRVLPVSNDQLASEVVAGAAIQLKNILEKNLSRSKTIWGFKDPFTASLLPTWFRIFNQVGVVPVFLLSVRNPAQSVISRKKHFGAIEPLGELAWLTNFTDALHHTAADCYIVHYEDWFSRRNELACELLQYTGLDQYFSGDVDAVLKGVIKPNLNRAVHEDYQIQNEYVLKLYDELQKKRGSDFDREPLMALVKHCRKAMDGFKGWYMDAQNAISRQARLRERLEDKRQRIQEVREIRDKLQMMCENQKAELAKLQILNHLERINNTIRRLEMAYSEVKKSFQWRVGNFVLRSFELFFFRKKSPMVTEHLERIFAEYNKNISVRDPDRKYLTQSIKWVGQIEKDFDALFASKRWKVGGGFVILTGRPFFRGKHNTMQGHVEIILKQFQQKNAEKKFTTSRAAN